MCLYTKQEAPKVATEDIECYKVLKKEDGKWVTPYRGYPVKFNEVMEAEGQKIDGMFAFGRHYEISMGYFHASKDSLGIYQVYKSIEVYCSREHIKEPELKTFKAIIPKGSNYYIGVRGDICSDKLIITEEIME